MEKPAFKIRKTSIEAIRSRFFFDESSVCLAPGGGGFGNRLAVAATHGCVPLIVQQHIALPFEEIVRYDTFAVHLESYKIHRLEEILHHYVDDERRMKRMAEALCRERSRFVWEWFNPNGTAFASVVEVLTRRL
jgi:hypothetical protein